MSLVGRLAARMLDASTEADAEAAVLSVRNLQGQLEETGDVTEERTHLGHPDRRATRHIHVCSGIRLPTQRTHSLDVSN